MHSVRQVTRCPGRRTEYDGRMNSPLPIDFAQSPRRVRWFMGIAWVLIVVKCVVVWWAMGHWQVPFHPMWIVGPTVAFATLASALWLTHQED